MNTINIQHLLRINVHDPENYNGDGSEQYRPPTVQFYVGPQINLTIERAKPIGRYTFDDLQAEVGYMQTQLPLDLINARFISDLRSEYDFFQASVVMIALLNDIRSAHPNFAV